MNNFVDCRSCKWFSSGWWKIAFGHSARKKNSNCKISRKRGFVAPYFGNKTYTQQKKNNEFQLYICNVR